MSKTLTAIQIGVLALLSPLANAYAPFVVKDIRVEGIQRTEAGTVFNYLPIRIGDKVGEDQVASAVKALYATGFYRDVRIEVDKEVLVVVVDERPAIAEVSFSGNKAFESTDLTKGLKEIGIVESHTFDRSQLEKAEQEIKRLYLTRSYYAVSVKTTVSPLERNRVAITFEISEGEVAKIKSIRILGATAFRESRLVDLMRLEESGSWYNWFRHNKYSKQELQADIEDLRSWYMDHGYVNFSVDSTQVSISPDKKDVYISIAINEGNQYKISSVKLAGELLLPEAELRKLVTLKSGDIYSRASVNAVTRAIADRLGNEGYAFANVNAAPEVNDDTREVALTLFVDPGRRAYVNKINITGNSRTRDEVIRREMLQMEDAWFDREKVDRSKTRINRTGFFEDVNVDTVPVTGAADQVDLNVSLKERATGSISVGLGYSTSDKLAFIGGISQNNLFGSGNSLSLGVNTGKVNRALNIAYDNAYWTADGVSRGFDLYDKRVDTTSLDVGGYKTDSIGTGIRFGIPIALDDKIFLGASVDHTRITVSDTSPQLYQDFVDEYGNTVTSLLTSVGWARDKRDSAVYPRTGTYQRFNTEVSVPPGKLRYAKMTYQWQRFFPLSSDYTLMLSSNFGAAQGYGGQSVPFYKNFYAGGIGSVRGFKDNSIGQKIVSYTDTDGTTYDAYIGGTRRVLGSAEVFFPFPGMKEKDRSLRLSYFVDAGTLWGMGESFSPTSMRLSAGLGMSWMSPVGPMKFSFGIPIKKEGSDSTQNFQFLFGTTL